MGLTGGGARLSLVATVEVVNHGEPCYPTLPTVFTDEGTLFTHIYPDAINHR